MAEYIFLPSEGLTEVQKAAHDKRRWKQNKVAELSDGVTWRKSGRDGFLYVKKNGRVLEIYYEICGDPDFDILLYWSKASWILPEQKALSATDRYELEADLSAWLKRDNTRASWS